MALALAIVTIALEFAAAPAKAKGGWNWHIYDRDGFIRPGQQVRAQGVFPAAEGRPTVAIAVPRWDWNNQPRRVPEDAIHLGALTLTEYRDDGEDRLRADVTFIAPTKPGDYVLATCAGPCERFLFPGPTDLLVVSGEVEERLLSALRDRDGAIEALQERVERLALGLEEAKQGMSTQLGYLGKHARRIAELEDERRPSGRGNSDGAALLIGGALLGGLASFAVARAWRNQPHSPR